MNGRKIVQFQFEEGVKCPECNWEESIFYGFEDTEEEHAICGGCFAQMLAEGDYLVVNTREGKNDTNTKAEP